MNLAKTGPAVMQFSPNNNDIIVCNLRKNSFSSKFLLLFLGQLRHVSNKDNGVLLVSENMKDVQ